MSAKLASEEKKPDGFFEILTTEALRNLIIDRSVRIIYGIGPKTEVELQKIGINTVRDIYNNKDLIIKHLGNHGKHLIDLAIGIDERSVISQAKSKSFGKEHTFQQGVTDYDYLKDVLRLIARELSYEIKQKGEFCKTITLKVTYKGFKKITRSNSGEATNRSEDIYNTVTGLLDKIDKRPIRLIGISLSGFTESIQEQISLFDSPNKEKENKLDSIKTTLQQKYGLDKIKTGSEALAEKRLKDDFD
jgi:DNA polymerase-4/DNA polymerase IV (DinB-like DNA polymerase)